MRESNPGFQICRFRLRFLHICLMLSAFRRRPFASTMVVEIFNNGARMATVNFSVPDDVKAEFDKTFGGENKSAVIAGLMRKAVADVKQRKRREEIFHTLTQRRAKRPSISSTQTRTSRIMGRP
jgi:hypothetical protein